MQRLTFCALWLMWPAITTMFVRSWIFPDRIDIRDGRHPVVEKMLADSLFIPNDTLLDSKENCVAIITGPNMAGKSTYMRQVALITIMAQITSFVPASSAHIGVADRVFTRVGASDDLASGPVHLYGGDERGRGYSEACYQVQPADSG